MNSCLGAQRKLMNSVVYLGFWSLDTRVLVSTELSIRVAQQVWIQIDKNLPSESSMLLIK